jgi:hypothetical protein
MRVVFMVLAMLAMAVFATCGSSDSSEPTGTGGGSPKDGGGAGGARATGGATSTGGGVGSGGRAGSSGQSGGATGSGGGAAVCPYTVTSFSCDAACARLHEIAARCKNDPGVAAETRAMLGLYGDLEVICTSSCAYEAPTAQAQWACFQGIPENAPCSAIGGCNASNCP